MTRPSIVLYEVPLPSSRTQRILGSLRAHGFPVRVVHHPRHRSRVEQMDLAGLPANLGGGNPLVTRVRRHLDSARVAGDTRRERLWTAVLDVPVPALTDRPGDVDSLVHQWLAAAEVMAQARAEIYWAADLDALPAAVWAAAANPGTRVVFDAHELFPHLDYLDPLQRPEWDQIAREMVPRVDLLLTVGEEMADRWRYDYGARTVEVIPNLAPAPEPSPTTLRGYLDLAVDTPLAVHVGNVVPNRRPELAIDLLRAWPELHVAFVGEVRYGMDQTLEMTATRAGVESRLRLVPPVPTGQLEEFISDADAAIILYSPERSRHLEVTMPNKLYDALAAGLPVVATDGLAPTRYVEEHGLGAGFPDGDHAAAVQTLRRVIADAQMRGRVENERKAARWPSIEEKLVDLVDAVGEGVRVPARVPVDQSSEAATAHPARPVTLRRVRAAVARRVGRVARWIAPS